MDIGFVLTTSVSGTVAYDYLRSAVLNRQIIASETLIV